MTPAVDLRGTGLSRRGAMVMAGRALMALSVAGASFAALGCSAERDPAWDKAAMVRVLSRAVTPGVAEAVAAANAAFVVRAVEAGLMGVPADALSRLAAELHRRSGGFMQTAPADQARVVEALDRETFAAKAPLTQPWYPIKALILMSYYTSEQGMTQELRYEPVPGRYDPDVPVDATWRPVSNDWTGISVKKPIAPR